ncbi:uncharacterized protein BCR38DRAFT_418742 [Pseudomassariella vexata]|uniref:Uncharacterized protein n=1 Tax=Pseudomassariella vexata TaxID=1141098 RepID=A0A1Y2EKI5_9PEZI|nr:uncharacterized protein BCR38DRAFT_418742 [Pseudomassariella vexata]ORY72053.1 hypothetical protein BCR38DRAFT_418742 [Pseudomassariella vexata]
MYIETWHLKPVPRHFDPTPTQPNGNVISQPTIKSHGNIPSTSRQGPYLPRTAPT